MVSPVNIAENSLDLIARERPPGWGGGANHCEDERAADKTSSPRSIALRRREWKLI
jgi:hypothetical protein